MYSARARTGIVLEDFMRHNIMNLAGGALTLLLVGAASSAQADIIAQDNASNAVYNGGLDFNGLQSGATGFQRLGSDFRFAEWLDSFIGSIPPAMERFPSGIASLPPVANRSAYTANSERHRRRRIAR